MLPTDFDPYNDTLENEQVEPRRIVGCMTGAYRRNFVSDSIDTEADKAGSSSYAGCITCSAQLRSHTGT